MPRHASDEEFATIKEKLENYMVKTLHQMDGEFNHPEIQQDVKASAYRRAKRERKHGGQI